MKKYLTYKNLPWAVVAAGFLGLVLHLWLMGTENSKGFIAKFHISAILLLVLTLAVVATLYILTRRLTQGSKYSFNFPASNSSALCAILAAVGIGVTAVTEIIGAADVLTVFSGLTGIVAALALLFVGHCRKQGLHPNVLAHVAICLHLMLRLICMYRLWSSDPQLYDYCFRLLAIACAMLAAYHRATFDANFGRRSSYAFYNLLAVFFCLISLSGSGSLYYLSLISWLLTDLCDLTPMPATAMEDGNEAA